MTPLDLTKARPRPPVAELDGIIFLPRTIDKARSLLPGGNKGDYNVTPGVSEAFLKHFDLEVDPFIEAVKNAQERERRPRLVPRAHRCEQESLLEGNAARARGHR